MPFLPNNPDIPLCNWPPPRPNTPHPNPLILTSVISLLSCSALTLSVFLMSDTCSLAACHDFIICNIIQETTVIILKIRTPEKIAIIILKFYYRVIDPKDADRMANSVDPEEQSDLGLHWFPRPDCYGILLSGHTEVLMNFGEKSNPNLANFYAFKHFPQLTKVRS